MFTTQDCRASHGFSHFLPYQPCLVGMDFRCTVGFRADAQGAAARKRGARTRPGPDCFLPNPEKKDKASYLRLMLSPAEPDSVHWISTGSRVPLRASPLLLGPQAQLPHPLSPVVPRSSSTCSFCDGVLWGWVALSCWGALQVGVRLPGVPGPLGAADTVRPP